MTKKLKVTCRECGSPNLLRDATAAWSEFAQCWELTTVHDHTTCEDCGAEGDDITSEEVL